jgi:hypothetical protein
VADLLNSEKIIAEAVRKYWEDTFPQDVVVFFYQKYGFEEHWRRMKELVICLSDDGNEMELLNDFCEGETDVKAIKIVPLDSVLDFYDKMEGEEDVKNK